jgi:KaiC/GvpD/RAD55 family RecA-like ATPase
MVVPVVYTIQPGTSQKSMTQTAATLHDLLGGALPGRIHLVTGGPGSGKSSACLHFLRAGMVLGQRTALLTLDRPRDLLTHAAHLGHDLRASVRDGRVSVIRYLPRFADRAAAAASPSMVIEDLKRMLVLADLQQMSGTATPLRIAIDPLSPLLSDGMSRGVALNALVDWLDETGATALLTWNGDVSGQIDRRMERLLEDAAVILKFERIHPSRIRAHVIRARHSIANTPPIDFEIRPGLGLSILPATAEVRREQISVSTPRTALAPPPVRDRSRVDIDQRPA